MRRKKKFDWGLLWLIVPGFLILVGVISALSGGGYQAIKATDYGVLDPEQAAWVFINESDVFYLKNVLLRTPDWEPGMSPAYKIDGPLAPGEQDVLPVAPGTYKLVAYYWHEFFDAEGTPVFYSPPVLEAGGVEFTAGEAKVIRICGGTISKNIYEKVFWSEPTLKTSGRCP